jgi:hypothetical protein
MRLGAIILAGKLIGAPWLLTGGKRKCNLERQGAGPAGLRPLDRRCGTHEQTHKLGLLRRAGLGVNVLQVGLGRVLADRQHLSRFLDAKPWRHGQEHT